jgi:hypothetical protein
MSDEPAIDESNRPFAGAESLTRNRVSDSRLAGIVIAAAPGPSKLREQIRGYVGRDRTPRDAW